MSMKILQVLVVATAMLLTSPCFSQEIFEEASGLYSTRVLKRKAKVVNGNKILIRSASTLKGYLNISTGSGPELIVKYSKRAKTLSRSRAIDYIDLIAVSVSKIPGGTRIELRAPNPAPWRELEGGLVEAEIIVPEGSLVNIEAQMFDVDAVGPLTGFIARGSMGRIEVSDVDGEVDIITANRRIVLDKIGGDISAATTNSRLEASNIVALDGRASFENEGGDITIDGLVGSVSVKNSYGRIEIREFIATGGRSLIRGESEPILIDVIEFRDGQLAVSNRYEDVELALPADISARLALSVEEGGRIEVTNLPVLPELVQETRLNIALGGGDSFIGGTIRGRGNIYVRGVDAE